MATEDGRENCRICADVWVEFEWVAVRAIAVLLGRSSLEFPLFAGSGKFQDKLIEETMRKE
ncbi:hypothetical protein [Laspinema olomoucense]|uniref:Uncharacterized protein n=1 Tax=Laspinema olomoucense D3b TaxID=2953688 RepID=A0ABT2NDT9_9CYAN|nr:MULTISPECIES: hypothetical protein [unclassified Laspinema]MCT7971440.1 hypothetical protein [Laspinema sp. D3d]MCT7979505.1 hypothetical protein [Laspinema sp. D3b]MCT7987309.1 hypothetical protein [Laspinema sp. D3a]